MIKFMFLSDNSRPVRIKDDKIYCDNSSAFGVFKAGVEEFLRK